MMRKCAVWLIGMALLCGVGSASAAVMTTASGPANVLVVFNQAHKHSIDLATHYQQARGIPASNMLAISGPSSWTAETNVSATEDEYDQFVYRPLVAKVNALTAAGKRIDYVVVCRNLPYEVSYTLTDGDGNPVKDADGNIITEIASLDAALMSPSGIPDFPVNNDFFKSTVTFADFKATTPGTLIPFLVTRLDGWTWDEANGLITQALAPRLRNAEVFLNVALAQDTLLKGVDKPFNDDLREAAAALTAAKVPNLLVSARFTRPTVPVSSYIVWGKDFDPSFSVGDFENVPFAPGALAQIIGSASATDLRARPTNQAGETQFGTLIDQGATGGFAYLENQLGIGHSQYMLENYFIQKDNLIDSVYSALEDYGFQEIVIGDPLCTYYGPGYFVPGKPTGVKNSAAVGGFDGWHVGAGNSSTEDEAGNPTNVNAGGAVGGTGGWSSTTGSTGTTQSW